MWDSPYVVAFDGGSVSVLPKSAPSCTDNEYTFLEDEVGMFYLTWLGSSSTLDHLIVEVLTLPTAGTLHQSDPQSRSMAGAMTSPGDDLVNYEGVAYFVPAPDGVGHPYSTFTYRLRDTSGLRSAACTITLNYQIADDVPKVWDGEATTVEEDSGRVLLSLDTFDVEGDSLGVFITSLPSKGKLYKTSDGTINGNLTHIDRPYAAFDVGDDVKGQYASGVNAVSSFWGSPPYAGYHALHVFRSVLALARVTGKLLQLTPLSLPLSSRHTQKRDRKTN